MTAQILGADEAPPPDRRPTYANGALWSAASGRFHPVRLRAAIVARGWMVGEFSASSGVSRACLYNVLRHQAASDRTVVRITQTLAAREPVNIAG